ncbi:MAG: hypothetical protein R3E87_09880 [Burkholderiaceae bacterium]
MNCTRQHSTALGANVGERVHRHATGALALGTEDRHRGFVAALTLLAVALSISIAMAAAPALAWENPPERQARIETLLDMLGKSNTHGVAVRLDQVIQAQWLHSGDEQIDGWVREAMVARHLNRLDEAITLLDRVVEAAPEYAEGWNQRAATFYKKKDDERSLADIERVLELQPRHYGAISGRALIAIRAGDAQTAIDDIEAARRINPFVGLANMLPALREVRNRTTGRPI